MNFLPRFEDRLHLKYPIIYLYLHNHNKICHLFFQTDERALQKDDLTINQRNCYDIRIREKHVLRQLLDLASTCRVYLRLPWNTLRPVAATMPRSGALGRFDAYLASAVVPLVNLTAAALDPNRVMQAVVNADELRVVGSS